MSPAQAMALIATLAVLLAVSSAAAGALWWRSRSWPMVRAAGLARELIERQKALEALVDRLESRLSEPLPSAPAVPKGPAIRADAPRRPKAGRSASRNPTLIAVPDLSADLGPVEPSNLNERFGDVWALAEAGESPDSIARSLGQPVGQVELILGLRRKIAAGSGS